MTTLYKNLFITITGLFLSLASVAHAASVNALFHHANAPVAGNPNGQVTIVEFFDYRCTHCASSAAALHSALHASPNVRAVFIDYPILGPSSVLAARAALAAKKQGKYVEFSQALLHARYLSESSIMDLAESMGLNAEQLRKDMYSSSVSNQIASNVRLAHSLNVYSTPAFFIGKTNTKNMNSVSVLYGGMSKGEFQSEIKNVGG